MKRLLVGLSIVAFAALSHAQSFVPGVILVGPKAGVTEQQLDKELEKHKGKKVKKLSNINVFVISVPATTEKAVVAGLKNNKHIKFAELDQLVAPSYTANDTYASVAYHLPLMRAPLAWDISEGAGITIAIADTGVRVTHQDLAANISTIPGYNFFDNNSDITDILGHGTAVASTAAGVTNNGIGIASLAGKAKILPIRIAQLDGYASYSNMASAITYAADKGARVLNCSYGGGGNSSTIQSAATYMAGKGGVVVWSAGNDNADLGFYDNPNIILVSATNSADVRTSWSSFGAYVDVAAPGEAVYVARYDSDSAYGTANGTSFSSPIVAGVVAQMLSVNPQLTMAYVDNILKTTAVDLGTAGEDVYYGHGRVDAYAAVVKARDTQIIDTTPPTVTFTVPAINATVSGSAEVNVSATDNIRVSRVELKVSNTTVASESNSPYNFIINTLNYPNGYYTLAASAYDDIGNTSTTTRQVYFSNNDVTPPTVAILNPVNGTVIPSGGKPVKITTSVRDEVGTPVTQKLYINNVLRYTGTTVSYNWKSIVKGSHTIRVDAFDTLNNMSSATSIVTKN